MISECILKLLSEQSMPSDGLRGVFDHSGTVGLMSPGFNLLLAPLGLGGLDDQIEHSDQA